MLKGEIDILSSIVLNKGNVRQITSSRIARSNSYVITTVQSLEKRGYIIKAAANTYHLTTRGIQAFMEFCPNHEVLNRLAYSKMLRSQLERTRNAITLIEKLGNAYSARVDCLNPRHSA